MSGRTEPNRLPGITCPRLTSRLDRRGALQVGVSDADLPALHRIHERGVANGVDCALIDKARLAELEPHATGVAAIHVPEMGIVTYR